MEQLPQRENGRCSVLFHTPRLCNKSRAMLLVQGLGLKTAVTPLEAIGSALSTQEVAEKPDPHYILIRSAGEVDAARDLPHPDELGAHHASRKRSSQWCPCPQTNVFAKRSGWPIWSPKHVGVTGSPSAADGGWRFFGRLGIPQPYP